MVPKKNDLSKEMRQRISNSIKETKAAKSKWLDLRHAGMKEIPEEVFDLVELEGIDLSKNRIKRVPASLWNLPRLKWVRLFHNPLQVLPNRPGLNIDVETFLRCGGQCDAENLHVFFAANGSSADADFLIKKLNEGIPLGSLTLGSLTFENRNLRQWIELTREKQSYLNEAVKNIIDSLASFQGLQGLSLRGLHLGSVPPGVSKLRQLKSLYLEDLHLKGLPDWIGNLDIESFSAIDNQLTDIPSSFGDLGALKELRLSFNPLGHIPPVIFDLVSLEHLAMDGCNLCEIPSDILRLEQLKSLEFDDSPVESPPLEVAINGLEAIRDYWRQRETAGVDYLCEAKLIILGEPGAGKTSLAQKIKDTNYQLRPDEASTEGIDVIHYQFPAAIRTQEQGKTQILTRDFQASIWDFGGQEIYHATHQFFLTRRSLYILVCDDRKEDTDFDYWLRIVELLSDASPILIVQNEKQDRSRDINLSSLRAQFGHLKEALSTNLETNRGLDAVIKAVQRELQQLPHIGTGLPATWKRVRLALEQDPRDHITLAEYLDICSKLGFTRNEDKLQLSGYLHDLGICLHFQDDPLLKNLVVLKPSWGTDAVYRVLDAPEVTKSNGRFSKAQLNSIWSEPKYNGMHDELLRLMMKFQLCYALEPDRTYIAPQLLSSDQPAFACEATGGIVVRYQYDFMPKGILSRFIVATHHLIASSGTLVWKTGVVLEKSGTKAEILEDYAHRRIRVRVWGPHPQGLFAIVDDHLARLHASFPRLKCETHLPCPCTDCRAKAEPSDFPLDKLVKRADKNQSIQCHDSGAMVDAVQLVRELMPGALRFRAFAPDFDSVEEALASAPPAPPPEVFVSYAWSDESSALVDKLQQAFEKTGTRLHRDREDIRYKDSIRDFMRRLGQGKCIVVILSEKYLKSDSCMFELTEIAKAQNVRDRIFPIVLADANIYKPISRVRYIKYWDEQKQELDEALKSVSGDNLTNLQAELNTYSEIRRLFDGIADTLKDMNALTPTQHEGTSFEELIRRVRAQLGSTGADS